MDAADISLQQYKFLKLLSNIFLFFVSAIRIGIFMCIVHDDRLEW